MWSKIGFWKKRRTRGWKLPKERRFLEEKDGRICFLFFGHVGVYGKIGIMGRWGCGSHRDLGNGGSRKGISCYASVARKVHCRKETRNSVWEES